MSDDDVKIEPCYTCGSLPIEEASPPSWSCSTCHVTRYELVDWNTHQRRLAHADDRRAWDAFAAAALDGMLAAHTGSMALPKRSEAAEQAAGIADAMMAERRKRRTQPASETFSVAPSHE